MTYNPGVTDSPQSIGVTYTVDLGTCVSLTHTSIVTGTSGGSAVQTMSCDDVLSASQGSQEIDWNTGQVSGFSYTRTVIRVNGTSILTLTGTIDSGLFAGDTAVMTIADPAAQFLACQDPGGLSAVSGTTSLVLS